MVQTRAQNQKGAALLDPRPGHTRSPAIDRAAAGMQMKSSSLHALLLLSVLVPSVASSVSLLAREYETADTLQSSLSAGGLEQPQFLSGILRELGLPSMQDVRLLNKPEQLELAESLREEGVNLGSRSKLRRLSETPVEPGDAPAPKGTLREKSGAGHRKTPGSGRSEREDGENEPRRQLQSVGGGISIEVAAIAVTGLIGMVGYAVQARSEGFHGTGEPGAGGGGAGEGGDQGGEATGEGAAADGGVGAAAQHKLLLRLFWVDGDRARVQAPGLS
jgi:hypothetical protein